MNMQKFNVEIVYTNEFNPRTEMSIVETTSFFTLFEAIDHSAEAAKSIEAAGRKAMISIWKFTLNEKLNVYSAPSSQPAILTLDLSH